MESVVVVLFTFVQQSTSATIQRSSALYCFIKVSYFQLHDGGHIQIPLNLWKSNVEVTKSVGARPRCQACVDLGLCHNSTIFGFGCFHLHH